MTEIGKPGQGEINKRTSQPEPSLPGVTNPQVLRIVKPGEAPSSSEVKPTIPRGALSAELRVFLQKKRDQSNTSCYSS